MTKLKHIPVRKGDVDVNLFLDLNNLIKKYVDVFCDKQDLVFDFWTADIIGTTASFSSSYFFNFDDIRMDLENGIKKDTIIEWQDFSLDNYHETGDMINYYSYLKAKKLL